MEPAYFVVVLTTPMELLAKIVIHHVPLAPVLAQTTASHAARRSFWMLTAALQLAQATNTQTELPAYPAPAHV
jgi:hypothetical protein